MIDHVLVLGAQQSLRGGKAVVYRRRGYVYREAMADTTTRWTWLAGDPPIVCRAFIAFVPTLDRYVCSVLSNANVSHHLGETADEATDEARREVEAAYGAIRVGRPERRADDLRIGRWNGLPLLLGGGEHGIPLQEAWVQAVSRGNSSQAKGYFARNVLPLLTEKQQGLLKEWVATGNWNTVPIDAVFAATYPDLDYLND